MVAEALDLPVVLVVDAAAGMESVAATVHGFREYAFHAGRDIDSDGVVAQRAHGGRHEDGIRDALLEGLAYLGRVSPRADLDVPDRHLGLHMAAGSSLDEAAESVNADRLLDIARTPPRPEPTAAGEPTGTRIAVARDAAFSFVYLATIERLRERADVITFLPLAGDNLPDCDGVYLPGSYPELHAVTLEESPTLDALAACAADGTAVFGECGGLIALAESLTTTEGETHEMAGVLPAVVRMHDRYRAFDHVELRATDGP